MFIRSERLFLRPGWPEDWAELHAVIDDEQIVRNLARAPWPYRPDDARWFANQPQDRRHPHFFVTLPGAHGTRLVGSVGLSEHEGETELGFWIGRSHWGKGYATEAARAVVNLARTLGHRRIVASHFIDNPASGHVLEKAGFVATGEICPRFGEGRRAVAPTVVYALELSGADNGDMEVMRAA
ncbi:GNAT family N-acetyltransferase [Novosphingobium sp. KCTC 2891]|uniref:GNAT family N-acetyltransferase n=1 Tax=Novosphingobium sp. KCTC 2891 TaxID=2989730 RepID=UPI002223985E|nr:GNAT family N-acetyltransferase [Novosphingobium sp. KCTC 2891]MCW1382585.1 GNAT family N-acetyltransferase [Novosphingobium sp. KCTC 2891]